MSKVADLAVSNIANLCTMQISDLADWIREL